ncbi:MAG: DUF5518 domain-containing protein [Euryarchaeota archaeon]|nr:DUF5518 domain-containing protein [Euryarchaeota archaeon]
MINWGVVIVGFLAEIILGGILGVLIPGWGALLGLLLAGMLVGYMVGGDAGNGAVNGAVAGAFGAIILSVLLLIFGTILLGLVGFAAASVTSMVLLLGSIGVIIIMALGGAVGSLIKGEPEASL